VQIGSPPPPAPPPLTKHTSLSLSPPLLEVLNDALEKMHLQKREDEQNLEQFINDFNKRVTGDNVVLNNNKKKRESIMKMLYQNMNPCKISKRGGLQLLFTADTSKGQQPKNMESFFRNGKGDVALAKLHEESNNNQVKEVFTKDSMEEVGAVMQKFNRLANETSVEMKNVRGKIMFEVSKKLIEIHRTRGGEQLTLKEVEELFLRLMQLCQFAKT